MFYPDKIKNIKDSDRVLEIGPGADPHPRADILLELELDRVEYSRQFGHDRKLETSKPVVYYDGKKFPFNNGEFDYIICSHVLEHVPDVPGFLSEVFRVGKSGYFEYPMITYEYLYNFDVHLNYVKWNGRELLYMEKKEQTLDPFKPVQDFFLSTLQNGYVQFFTKIPEYFIEGFEWKVPFNSKTVSEIKSLVPDFSDLPFLKEDLAKDHSFKSLALALSRKVKGRVK